MRRLMAILLAATMLFSLMACTNTDDVGDFPSQSSQNTQSETKPTDATTLPQSTTLPQFTINSEHTQAGANTEADHVCSWIQVSCELLECEICGVNDLADAHVWWQIDSWTEECGVCGEVRAFPCDHEWRWLSEDHAECLNCGDTRTDLHVHEWKWLDDATAGCICGETKAKPCRHQWEQIDETTAKCAICGMTRAQTCYHKWKWISETTKECTLCGKTKSYECEHEWSEATCYAPKTCYKCNATEGETLDHDWLEADCINPVRCKYCLECKGSALGHVYVSGVCTRCGGRDNAYIPTFHAGEKWIVDQKFELSFEDVVPLFRVDGQQTVQITWKYKNLSPISTLSIGRSNFIVYDSQMKTCEDTIYGVYAVNPYGQQCAPGVSASCVGGYILNETESQIRIYVEVLGERAYFQLDTLPYKPYAIVTLDTELPSNVTFRYEDHYCVCRVTDVKLDIKPAINGGGSLRATFSGTKTYDNRSESSSFDIGWKLYDQDNKVVKSGYTTIPSLREGESFADISTSICRLEEGGSYRLVLRSIQLNN